MKFIHRILLLVALLTTAFICHLAGATTGTYAFIILGVAMEILYWLQLIPKATNDKG